jgi:hypothetical protein
MMGLDFSLPGANPSFFVEDQELHETTFSLDARIGSDSCRKPSGGWLLEKIH